jgi:tRNA A-37 threonylcarbamoyl transferase component Bud32
MELIGSGAQADIYINNGMAIKLFKKNVSKHDIEYEMNLQKMASEIGLPVPKIYNVTKIDGKYGFVMEYINGVSVGSIILNDINMFYKYLIKSIEIQINIHKIKTDNFPSMKEKLHREITNAQLISDDEKQKILEMIGKINFDQYLCHGDFHFMNLLETSDGIKIIDWVNSSSGNIEADACRTYLIYKVQHEEAAEIYIENYCKIANIPNNKVFKWVPIIAAASLSDGMGKNVNEKLLKIVKENI